MNPLINRLFENRSKSKTKRQSLHRQDNSHSLDKALIPKIPAKLKLQALVESLPERRKSTMARVFVGKLPSIPIKMQQTKEMVNRNNFRNRKLSSSIREMTGNLFSTELDDSPVMLLTEYQSEEKLTKVDAVVNDKPIQQPMQKEHSEEELFQYLKVLQNNEDLNQQFCYMNRGQMPYSFYIVDYEERRKEEHLTVSLRGITYYKQDDSEFYTIRKLKNQIENYKKIKNIYFFENYLIAKVILHWKQTMIRRKFNLKCKHIMTHLFSQNHIIQNYLHFLHNLAQDYSGGNFFNFNITITNTLEQFNQTAELGTKELIKNVKKFDNYVQKTLRGMIQSMLVKFRADERVTLGSGDKKRQEQPYLPFDSKRRSMKYTQMAKLKQFQGMMYKMIKYTDLVRFNVKANLVRKCYENSINDLKNLKKSYENKDLMRFTNWIQISIGIQESEGVATITCSPPLQYITQAILAIRQNLLKELFREHRLFIQKKQSFCCQNLDIDEDQQKPSRMQLKYYVLKNNEFQQLNSELHQSLKEIITAIQQQLTKYHNVLLQIYNKNINQKGIDLIFSNQKMRQYLSNYRQEFDIIANCEEVVEFALVVLKITQLKEKIRRSTQQKYKLISNAIPAEVVRRCDLFFQQLKSVYIQFKENPYNVHDFILFINKFHTQKGKMFQLQATLQQILQFQDLVYKYGIRIGESAKLYISQCQTYYKELNKRFDQIQSSEEETRKKFENMVDQMIPSIQEKSEELLKEIHQNNVINNYASEVAKAQMKLAEMEEIFNKLRVKKEQLFEYQREMMLGHRQLQFYDKLKDTISYYVKIWEGKKYFGTLQQQIKSIGYGRMNSIVLQPLLQFMNNIDAYSSTLECFQLIQQFKTQITAFLKVVKISQLVSADTLQQQHISMMKKIIKPVGNKFNVQFIFHKEGKNTISCEQLYNETNAQELEIELSQIVFQSAQENIVKAQLSQIQQFWKKNKIKLILQDIAQNQIPILHLDANEQLHEKLGYFVVMLKNIEGSFQIIGLARERATVNYKICVYLREFLWKWQEVEKQWIKLLPLMTNCPAVKHQSNVFFEFASVDTNLKKIIKQVNQMSSLRKVCDDAFEGRFKGILANCQDELNTINKTFNHFLQNKRATYGRFFFLSDFELINILQHVKDAKSTSKFVKYMFNCEELQLDGELMAGFGHKSQIIKLRKTILRGETDQIFKHVEENMNNSIKLMVRALLPKIKIQPNVEQELKDYPTQVTLIVDRLFWTEMSELYLNTTSFSQYKIVMKSFYESMTDLIPKIDKSLWFKLAIRILQAMRMYETSMQLVRQQITVNDFKWKEQMRFSQNQEDIIVSQFDNKLLYGCEYYPPTNISIPTLNSTRFLYESYYSCVKNRALVVRGQEGEGKRNLIYNAGVFFGVFQKEVVCSEKLSKHFVNKFVQGALAAGAWLSFYEFDSLNYSVCGQLFDLVAKVNRAEVKIQQSLFLLVHHDSQVQQISIYSFNNFAVFEPDRQKISMHLLEIYKFKASKELSIQLIRFFQCIKPFLDRIMGSQLGLIKKVIEKAGTKRIDCQIGVNQSALIAEAILSEVISKERQSKFDILCRALVSYFDTHYQSLVIQDKYSQKLQTLNSMISDRVNNIVVLGQRSCKSTLIKQSLALQQRDSLFLYAQASTFFFSNETIQYLRGLPTDLILIYDANQVIGEWTDLITCDELFMEGKRVVLQNQKIMQLRDISDCSPSFVGKCQILYIGQHLVTKLQKLNKLFGKQHINYNHTIQVLKQMFGDKLQNISQNNLNTISRYLLNFQQIIPIKSLHKLVVWLISAIDKETAWSRHYGGRYTDYTINSYSYQLFPVDNAKYQTQQHSFFSNYLIVPTRMTTLLMDSINTFLSSKLHIHLSGPSQAGKTSLLELFHKKLQLRSSQSVEEWSESLKRKYTFVRKEGKNILIDIEKEGHKIVIDDLDLGASNNMEYLRVLMHTSSIRDKLFNQFFIQKYQLIACSRQVEANGKYWSQVCKLTLNEIDRQCVQTIVQINFARQIQTYSMNREVQDLITGSITRAIIIAQDDLCNIIGNNSASSLLLALLRNLLSLPKSQAFLSADSYIHFFKTHFHFKLQQKSMGKKLQWQIKSVQDNILKVCFGERLPPADQYFVNKQGQYFPMTPEDVKATLLDLYPNLICFDALIESIIYLVNQFHCADKDIVILGRKGTGKKLILQLCSKLTGIRVIQDISEAIIAAIKKQPLILVQSLESNVTFYEQLFNCESDKDLQKLLKVEKREQYYTRVAGEQLGEEKILMRCRRMIMHAFLAEDRQSYNRFCEKRREVLNLPICLIEEWPPQAILFIYQIQDPYPNLHAQLFTTINKQLNENSYPSLSLKMFQKYLKVYGQIYQTQNSQVEAKLQKYSQIHFKFNQSCQMIKAWEARVQILRKQIEQAIAKAKKVIVVNQLYTFALSILHKQIKSQEEAYSIELAKQRQLNAEIQKKIILMKKVMAKIQKIVSSFQRTELSQLKKIYKLNKLVYFGVQCLCILLGQENTDQKTMNRLLADPNLLMKMKAPEMLTHRNAKLQAKMKKELSSFQNQIRNNSSQMAKTLIEWVRSLIDYWETSQQHRIQQEQHEKVSVVLELSFQKHSELSREVLSINNSINQKNQIIQSNEIEKTQKEHELNSIEQRISNAQTILPILKQEEQQTKSNIEQLTDFKDKLRGNSILTALTATMLPLQSLHVKQRLLNIIRGILRKNLVSFSSSFMAQISGSKMDSLQALNYYLLFCTKLPKLVIDPHRKFINYIQKYAPLQMRDTIVQNAELLSQLQESKIYHTTIFDIKANKEEIIIIDWAGVALQEREAIFLGLAQFKKPQYFQVKGELQIKIARNMLKLKDMKEVLYAQICVRQMKIIQDNQFIQNSVQLRQLEIQTQTLQAEAEQKIKQIQLLAEIINEQVTKIIHIHNTIKIFRRMDIKLVMNICCQEGDSIAHFIAWSLANIQPHHRVTFAISLVVAFNKQTQLQLLREVVNKNSLKVFESKVKKPNGVSVKNWQTITKLSNYSPNLKRIHQNIMKSPKQYQQWCYDSQTFKLPPSIAIQNMQLIEYIGLLYFTKPNSYAYFIPQLLSIYLPQSLLPLANHQIIDMSDSKFPVIVASKMDWLTKVCRQSNEGRFSLHRVCKINGQVEMKRLIWRSMQARQWMIFYDVQTGKDVQMMEEIVYYVINYDKHPGFRIFLLIDSLQQTTTKQQQLLTSSAFLSSISVNLFEEQPSCDSLLGQNQLQYQISISGQSKYFTSKHIFNRMFRLIIICFSVLQMRHHELRNVEFKRITAVLQYIKSRAISVQFNVSTVVHYISRLMSYCVASPELRKAIQEIWQSIVDQTKITQKIIYGVPFMEDNLDQFIRNNHALIGCEQSTFIREAIQQFQPNLLKLAEIYDLLGTKQQILAFLRSQLSKLPIFLTGKEMNNNYSYFYDQQVKNHNKTIQQLINLLEHLNQTNTKDEYLQTTTHQQLTKMQKIFQTLQTIINCEVTPNTLRNTLPVIISRLRRQHDFLLYFNPSVNSIIVEPTILHSLPTLVATRSITQMQLQHIQDAFNYQTYMQFTKFNQQKDIGSCQGLFIINLQYQEFIYNVDMKTIEPNLELNGIEAAPVVCIKLKPARLQEWETEGMELQIYNKHRSLFTGLVQFHSVYGEWSLRSARLLVGL